MRRTTSSSSSEALDLQAEFDHVLAWLWSTEVITEQIDCAETRNEVERILRTKFHKNRSQVTGALNRLIEQGNAEGRFRFRLFPEPVYMAPRRWFEMSPANDAAAQAIAFVRSHLLQTVVHEIAATPLTVAQKRALLLVTLTLDDGWTNESMLRTLVGDAQCRTIQKRPFLVFQSEAASQDECVPVGYCTARVLASLASDEQDGSNTRADLRALYRRACSWIARHPDLGAGTREALPPNVRRYLSVLRFEAATSGIPAVAYTRATRHTSVALGERAVVRLLSGKPLAGTRQGDVVDAELAPRTDGATQQPLQSAASGALDARVCHTLHQWRSPRHSLDEPGEVAEAIASAMREEDQLSLEYLLASWAHALALASTGPRPRYRAGTVHTYYTSLANLLRPHFGNAPADVADAAGWEDFYDEVSEFATEVRGQDAWRRLKDFHRHIVKWHQAGSVSLASADPARRIDNNVITPKEYRRALSLLALPEPRPRVATCARILMILGFRFGLRLSEARQVELRQIEDAASPWIHIHENRWQAELKSDSRRLPFHPLVPPEEREELLAFRRTRLHESGGDESAALVSDIGGDPGPISEARVRPWLREAIFKATGDPTTRYHHLRHSFASWALLRFLRPLIDDRLLQGVDAFADDQVSRTTGQAWRDRLLVQQEGQEALWLVSQMLGHASIETTRRSYWQLIEWISLCETWSGRDPDPDALGRLLGVAHSTAHELRSRWGKSYRRATRDWPRTTQTGYALAKQPPQTLHMGALTGSGAAAEMEALCQASRELGDATNESSSLDRVRRVARRWSVSADVLARYWQASATVYSAYRTKKGRPRFAAIVRLPRDRIERTDLDALITSMATQLETGSPGTRFGYGRLIVAARRSISRDRTFVRLPSIPSARRYSELLTSLLGIPANRQLLLVAPIQGESYRAWDRRRRRLAKAVGFPVARVQRREAAPAAPHQAPALEISVESANAAAGASNTARVGSRAYRALIHYVLVCFTMRRIPAPELPQNEQSTSQNARGLGD